MFLCRPSSLSIAVVVLGCSTLLAQSYPVATVTFSGDPSFSSAELLAVSGLTVGSSLDQAAMQAGAARLDATGMFATTKFSFNGKELHYEVAPAGNLLPVRFANFPWWETKEIAAQLTVAVPLFHGRAAPDSGTARKIGEALTAMLAARQVAATVTATPDVDRVTGKALTLDFHVIAPLIQIGTVSFTGTSAEFGDRLAEIAKAAAQVDYYTYETPATLTQAVQSIYFDHGYLEAKVPSVKAQAPVMDTATGATLVKVPVVVAVEEGAQYRLGQFSVAGSVLMSQSDFFWRRRC